LPLGRGKSGFVRNPIIMAQIDLRQLDNFKYTFLDDVLEDQVPAWDANAEEFVPRNREEIVFRRAMLLMGG